MRIEEEIKQTEFKSEYHKLILNLMFTGGWLSLSGNKRLKPFKISIQQYNILRILRGLKNEPATLYVLQERMLDKTSNTSRLVEKLRLKGLIIRRSCDNDRRAVDIFITPKGSELLHQIDAIDTEWELKFTHLSIDEACELNRLLDKLRS